VTDEGTDLRLSVRVNSGSSRRKAVWKGEFLKVNLTSPPEEGRANQELCEFLADEFDLSVQQVDIERGHTARRKELLLKRTDRSKMVQMIREMKG
jgi:uncharacterized protein (TIGR00251 family)